MDDNSFFLTVDPGPGAPPEAVEDANRALAEELRALPGVTSSPASQGAAPDGSKALESALMGLVVAGIGSGAVIPTLIGAIKDWLTRQRPSTTIKVKKGDLEFEWTGTTPPDDIRAAVLKMAQG